MGTRLKKIFSVDSELVTLDWPVIDETLSIECIFPQRQTSLSLMSEDASVLCQGYFVALAFPNSKAAVDSLLAFIF